MGLFPAGKIAGVGLNVVNEDAGAIAAGIGTGARVDIVGGDSLF